MLVGFNEYIEDGEIHCPQLTTQEIFCKRYSVIGYIKKLLCCV